MRALVLVQVVLPAESLAAELTAERTVTRVDTSVASELLVSGELLVTCLTLERPLTCGKNILSYFFLME